MRNEENLVREINIIVLSIVFFLFSNLIKAQNVQLEYDGKNDSLILVIAKANRILKSQGFYEKISSFSSFDNSNYTGGKIAKEFKELNHNILVETYWNPFGIANAKTVSVIKLNSAKLKRDQESILNTIIHEAVHAVDWLNNRQWDYTHDGNRANGQNQTAPWVIGEVAEEMEF